MYRSAKKYKKQPRIKKLGFQVHSRIQSHLFVQIDDNIYKY